MCRIVGFKGGDKVAESSCTHMVVKLADGAESWMAEGELRVREGV